MNNFSFVIIVFVLFWAEISGYIISVNRVVPIRLIQVAKSQYSLRNPMLKNSRFQNRSTASMDVPADNNRSETNPRKSAKSFQLLQRWITGLSLGAIGTMWLSAGNGPFTLGFLITSIIAQSEYYRMVTATKVYPAYKTGIVSSIICFVTAAMIPAYHELVMPLSATLLVMWFLIFTKRSATINEISTSLLGMFYLGYLPSFWVRLRSLDTLNPSRLHSMANLIRGLNPECWTVGVTLTWWTWTSIVFSDVGAYFIGKSYGRNKLSKISSAAGAASPNKTVEGAVGGFVSGTSFFLLGAYLMQWPYWQITGTLYGLMITMIALLGDLTASMMKRDAGFKDTGSVLPGHGGLLDRIDSYMFTAPAAFFFCKCFLPLMQKLHDKRALAPFL